MQELEIEYKNLLSKSDYDKILTNEFSKCKEGSYSKILQENYYFDTKDQLLKSQKAALRIRRLENKNELTFKVPSGSFLMETNILINDSDVEKILKNKKLSLYSLIDESLDLKLNGLSKNTIFYLINSFKTLRYEKEIKNNLLVLDQTFFQNQAIDYELEVEGQSSSAAKKYFKSILEKYSIPNRGKMPKIARAEKNKADRAL